MLVITVRTVSLTVGLTACQKLVLSQNCCYKGSNKDELIILNYIRKL